MKVQPTYFPVYLEYEISPLGYELPILIPNFGGKFFGWRPWYYEGDRKTQKATTATGGSLQPGAKVTGWKAEVFVPYDLLKPLQNVPPKSGTRWRANFYIVSITMPARARAGTGPGSDPVFTNLKNSARSYSNRTAQTDGLPGIDGFRFRLGIWC